jgi:uncharacterized protein YbaP (TraB family)
LKLIRYFAGIVGVLVLQASATAQPPRVPALRVTAPSGATSVLIGSLHVAADGLAQPSPELLRDAKRYVIEGVPGPFPARFMEIAPAVKQGRASRADWAAGITQPQFDEFVRRLTCNPLPVGSSALEQANLLLALDSAMLASAFAINHCASPGLLSRDRLLMQAAIDRGLSPEVLETPSEVNKQRESLPEHIYRHTFHTAFTPASKQGLRRAIRGLNSGAYDEVTAALRDLAASPEDASVHNRLMLTERNHIWIPRLVKHLQDGSVVVNVGVAHLPGPNGLIELLRRQGFKVKPILLPAGSSVGSAKVKSDRRDDQRREHANTANLPGG